MNATLVNGITKLMQRCSTKGSCDQLTDLPFIALQSAVKKKNLDTIKRILKGYRAHFRYQRMTVSYATTLSVTEPLNKKIGNSKQSTVVFYIYSIPPRKLLKKNLHILCHQKIEQRALPVVIFLYHRVLK